MTDIIRANVISYPEVKEKNVIFWCYINHRNCCCISNKKKQLSTILFIRPGQTLYLSEVSKVIVLIRNRTIMNIIYVQKIRVEV